MHWELDAETHVRAELHPDTTVHATQESWAPVCSQYPDVHDVQCDAPAAAHESVPVHWLMGVQSVQTSAVGATLFTRNLPVEQVVHCELVDEVHVTPDVQPATAVHARQVSADDTSPPTRYRPV